MDERSIQADLAYMQSGGVRPYNYAYQPPDGEPWENYQRDARNMPIRDARGLASAPAVDADGFALCDAPTALRNFTDPDQIARAYYPEVAQLALAVTGARAAYVFDHLVRQREPDRRPLGFGRAVKGALAAANGCVHNDYTEESGRKRLALVTGEMAAQQAGRRHAIVNVWRPLRGPVLDTPLALCAAGSVDAADLVSAEVRYPRRTGEIYLLRHSARHRWFYFSAMEPHEALVFKQYDSQLGGVARFTPHAAFEHPAAPQGVPPRISIEARCLVVYD